MPTQEPHYESSDNPSANLIDVAPVPPGNHIEGEYVVADGYHVISESRIFDITRDRDDVRIKELINGHWKPLCSFPFTWVACQS